MKRHTPSMKHVSRIVRRKRRRTSVRRILLYLRPFRRWMLLSLLLALITVVLTLSLPVLTGRIIDLMENRHTTSLTDITPLLLASALIILCTAASEWLMNLCHNRISFGVVRSLRADAFGKIQRLPLAYLDNHPTGDIVSRIVTDADQFTDGLLMGFSRLFTGVLTILGTLGFMLSINGLMTLWVVLITPLSLFAASFIAGNTYTFFHRQSEILAEETALIEETVGSHKTVVVFSHEKQALADFDEVNTRLKAVSEKAVFFSSLVNPVTRFVNNLVYAGAALIGALISLSGPFGMVLTAGQLFCFLSYANQYTKPFNEISGVLTELQNALACADRLLDLIGEAEEIPDRPDATVLRQTNGCVALQDVSFSYTPDRELIRHFSLSLGKGQRVAIVGPTGCGKTTVINLLLRFYDVDDGSIQVDGHDIRSVTRHSLREQYGMVLQDSRLFAGTIRDNIALKCPDADESAVIAAAQAAHADSFIRRLPQGYETRIGEDGGTLSEGQKQLLCIARVFLALPPMLILDEATSSVDTRTEMKIQQALADLMQGRTSFIVAHRLSTVRTADVILVMKDGQIIERGDHASLLARHGFYADLYNSQFET